MKITPHEITGSCISITNCENHIPNKSIFIYYYKKLFLQQQSLPRKMKKITTNLIWSNTSMNNFYRIRSDVITITKKSDNYLIYTAIKHYLTIIIQAFTSYRHFHDGRSSFYKQTIFYNILPALDEVNFSRV